MSNNHPTQSNNTIPFKYSDVELNVSNRAPPPLQVARFAAAQKEKNARYLDITTVYDGTPLKGMRVLVTGGEQNLGLEIIKEIVAQGGEAISAGRTSSKDLDEAAAASDGKIQVITDIDVCKEEAMAKMVAEVEGPLDMVINNAGYFYGPEEKVGVGGEEGHLNFQHQMLQVRRARERSRRGRRARDRATTTAARVFQARGERWSVVVAHSARVGPTCRRPRRPPTIFLARSALHARVVFVVVSFLLVSLRPSLNTTSSSSSFFTHTSSPRQIDVCALGPLRISSALYKGGKLVRDGKPGKIVIITSQAGSCEWRLTQNAPGGAMNYGQ